jgi:hypothetical protein
VDRVPARILAAASKFRVARRKSVVTNYLIHSTDRGRLAPMPQHSSAFLRPFSAPLADSEPAARVFRAAADLGLLVRGLPTNDTIAFSPPFVVSEVEINEITRRFSLSLDRVAAELERDRLWLA